MAKDFYQVLGLKRDADEKAIKGAYRTHADEDAKFSTSGQKRWKLSKTAVPLWLLLAVPMMGAYRVEAQEIRVAAAADLKYALDEIIAGFEKGRPGASVSATYGSSGNLFAQLGNGAPFDLFLSADAKFPRRLMQKQKAAPDSFFLYAVGRLVIWVPNASPLNVTKLKMQALLAPGVRKISIANPQHAPYGQAAVAAMKKAGVYEGVKENLVLGENVAQAAQFVQAGAADVGIIALSLAKSSKMQKAGRYWEIPLSLFPRLEQGGIVLSSSRNPMLARQFRAQLTGKSARSVLTRYGFILPAPPLAKR